MNQENRRLEQAQRSIENEKRYLTVLEDAYEKLRNGARPESAMYVAGTILQLALRVLLLDA